MLRLRAHAKVNLALRVGALADDGYHRLATVYQTVSLHDRLRARRLDGAVDGSDGPRPAGPDAALQGSVPPRPGGPGGVSGVPARISISGTALPADNTVAMAVQLFARHLRARGRQHLPPIELHLDKRLPVGSGLGGGSSDAVAALAACALLWCPEEPPCRSEIEAMAACIGADVPFFVDGGTALGSGRGDRVVPLEELPRQWLVLVSPQLRVSTAEAYAAFDDRADRSAAAELEPPAYRPHLDRSWMGNDLAAVVAERWPAVEEARQALRAAGAGIAQMTGSGSASFGTFPDRAAAQRAARELRRQGWWARACSTVSRAEHGRSLGGPPWRRSA